MQTENIIIIHPDTTEKLEALQSILTAFKLRFEVQKPTYNPDMVHKITKSREEIKAGNYRRVPTEDLKTFLGVQ